MKTKIPHLLLSLLSLTAVVGRANTKQLLPGIYFPLASPAIEHGFSEKDRNIAQGEATEWLGLKDILAQIKKACPSATHKISLHSQGGFNGASRLFFQDNYYFAFGSQDTASGKVSAEVTSDELEEALDKLTFQSYPGWGVIDEEIVRAKHGPFLSGSLQVSGDCFENVQVPSQFVQIKAAKVDTYDNELEKSEIAVGRSGCYFSHASLTARVVLHQSDVPSGLVPQVNPFFSFGVIDRDYPSTAGPSITGSRAAEMKSIDFSELKVGEEKLLSADLDMWSPVGGKNYYRIEASRYRKEEIRNFLSVNFDRRRVISNEQHYNYEVSAKLDTGTMNYLCWK